MHVKLNKPFARNSNVDINDTLSIKHTLGWLGYYKPDKKIGMNQIPDTAVFKGLKSFQKDYNLKPTGEVKPDDETMKTLNRALAEKIEREELPPIEGIIPKIPGTNIPDHGIPEQGFPGSDVYDPFAPDPMQTRDPGFERWPLIEPQMPIYEELPPHKRWYDI